jgi:transposase, IS5 family
VRCFNKGKLAKGLQCGRACQLGRIGGNCLLVAPCTSVRMEDNASVRPMIRAHQKVCGQDVWASCGMDQGYDSPANHQYWQSLAGLKEFCLQQPGLDISRRGEDAAETYRRLVNRRSGLEPLIGHATQGGQLGQSRMKTDETTLAAGYGAIGGFNLRQLIRHLLGKDIKPMG